MISMACTCEVIILGSVFPGEHLVNQTLSFALCALLFHRKQPGSFGDEQVGLFVRKKPDYRCKNERETLEKIRDKGYVLVTKIYTF